MADSFLDFENRKKIMKINLYLKSKWKDIYLNLLKSGTIEKQGPPL
jgi:hypothetical protein